MGRSVGEWTHGKKKKKRLKLVAGEGFLKQTPWEWDQAMVLIRTGLPGSQTGPATQCFFFW